jgi:hypothetical protein
MSEVKQQELVALDESTVRSVLSSVYLMINLNKTKTHQDLSSSTRWTEDLVGLSVDLSDRLKKQDREQWVVEDSTPDELMASMGWAWSIWWTEETRQRAASCRGFNTGWTYGATVVHLTAWKKLTIRIWSRSYEHRMNRRCVSWSVR